MEGFYRVPFGKFERYCTARRARLTAAAGRGSRSVRTEQLCCVVPEDLALLLAGHPSQQGGELGRLGQALGVREVRPHHQAVDVGEVADDTCDVVLRVGHDPDVPPEDGTGPLGQLATDPGAIAAHA